MSFATPPLKPSKPSLFRFVSICVMCVALIMATTAHSFAATSSPEVTESKSKVTSEKDASEKAPSNKVAPLRTTVAPEAVKTKSAKAKNTDEKTAIEPKPDSGKVTSKKVVPETVQKVSEKSVEKPAVKKPTVKKKNFARKTRQETNVVLRKSKSKEPKKSDPEEKSDIKKAPKKKSEQSKPRKTFNKKTDNKKSDTSFDKMLDDTAAKTALEQPAVAATTTVKTPPPIDLEQKMLQKAAERAKRNQTQLPFNGSSVGEIQYYIAGKDDTFNSISRAFNVGYVELISANPNVDPWLPKVGTKIVIPALQLLPEAPQSGIVINLADMRLYHFRNAGQPPETYPIGIGREGLKTPQGSTTVVRKAKDPTWSPTPRMRKEKPELPATVGPGPDNPLGNRAMYLGWAQYLIHGTNKPSGIGRRTSSGCIRMFPEDVQYLFELVPVGSPVTVVYQTVKTRWINGELFLEVQPDFEQIDQLEFEEPMTERPPEGLIQRVGQMAGNRKNEVNWELVRLEGLHRSGIPIQITNIKTENSQKQEAANQQDKTATTTTKPSSPPVNPSNHP